MSRCPTIPRCHACGAERPTHRVDLGADGGLLYHEQCIPSHLALAVERIGQRTRGAEHAAERSE